MLCPMASKVIKNHSQNSFDDKLSQAGQNCISSIQISSFFSLNIKTQTCLNLKHQKNGIFYSKTQCQRNCGKFFMRRKYYIRNHLNFNAQKHIKFQVVISIYNYFLMEFQLKMSNKPKNYAKIPLNKRIKLVELVQQKSLSISKASIKLGIRPSTAKLILKKYREEGTFFEKRSDRLTRIAIQKEAMEPSQAVPMHQPSPSPAGIMESPQFLPSLQYEGNNLCGGVNAFVGMSEINSIQNYLWGGFSNYGLIQYPASPFFF